MPNFDNNWLPTDYDGVIELLKGASNGYGTQAEIKGYGCFKSERSFENPRDLVTYLEGLRGNELDDSSSEYWHYAASEDLRKQGQPDSNQKIYKDILTDKKRYDLEKFIHPASHRQITGTETHTIRIIKNRKANGILDEWTELDPAIGEEGRIEITYKQPRYGLAHGSCAEGACAFE